MWNGLLYAFILIAISVGLGLAFFRKTNIVNKED